MKIKDLQGFGRLWPPLFRPGATGDFGPEPWVEQLSMASTACNLICYLKTTYKNIRPLPFFLWTGEHLFAIVPIVWSEHLFAFLVKVPVESLFHALEQSIEPMPQDTPEHKLPPLTKPQQMVLDAIRYFLRKGEVPTVREVGALIGLRSPATVLKHLRALEKEKLISLSGKSRGIRLTRISSFAPPHLAHREAATLQQGTPQDGTLKGGVLQDGTSHDGLVQRDSLQGGSVQDGEKSLPTHSPGSLSSRGPLDMTTQRILGSPRSHGIAGKFPGVPVVGAIAAGKPFESYSDGFFPWGESPYSRGPWRQDTGTPADHSPHGNYSGGNFSGGDPSGGLLARRDVSPADVPHGDSMHGDSMRSDFSYGDFRPEAFLPEKLRSPHPAYQDPQDFEGHSGASFTEEAGETVPQEAASHGNPTHEAMDISIDPRMFTESGEIIALQVHGDSMVQAGILDGDYAIIRRQNTVEEGEIAAVIINGEGTLKRWRTRSCQGKKTVSLHPANEHFDPIEITEENAKDVLVFGKYVGLVRGNLRFA